MANSGTGDAVEFGKLARDSEELRGEEDVAASFSEEPNLNLFLNLSMGLPMMGGVEMEVEDKGRVGGGCRNGSFGPVIIGDDKGE